MQIEQVRAELSARLRARRAEIEQATLARVHSVSDPEEIASPEYTEGLRVAVSAALDYGIEALGRSEDRAAPIPTALRSQARLAARNGVELDTVLRRYLAGHTLLDDFLIEESEGGALGLSGTSLKRLLRVEAAALDRLLVAVSEEYAREAKARPGSPEERRARQIERLLAGEPLDTTELSYSFEGWHLGLLASGPGAPEAIKALARGFDARLLAIPREGQVLWAWLGSRRRLDPAEVLSKAQDDLPGGLALAIGESGEGLGGWRFSHRQALAALAVAQRGQEAVVRYGEVALLASVLGDELLANSLRKLYLEPLEAERDGGEVARATLRAYFAAGQNVSSTAAALEINRSTAAKRLHAIEERIGRQLTSCGVELSIALRLSSLGERGRQQAA